MGEFEYDILGYYGSRLGWEVVTCEETKEDAVKMIQCYRENEPGVPFKARRVRRNNG